MRATHTPGPWWLVAGHGFVDVTTGPDEHRRLATVTTDDAEGVANVRAVVRVPEMIAALEACVEAGDAARALLARIRGEVAP